jgi:prephenate dehydrogenase
VEVLAAFTIITNNPLLYERFKKKLKDDVVWVNASAQEVLTQVRNAIHKGAVLLSHPLSGSMQPGLSPYKSVLVSKPQPQVDFQSVKYIEEAAGIYRKNAKLKYMSYNDKMLNDFQVIDMDLMASALSGLPHEYIH